MGFAVHLEKGVYSLFMERKMHSGHESSSSKQFNEAGLDTDVASIEGSDLILVLRALRRLSGELRKINVSLTNQIYSLRETVHDYSQRVSEDFSTMEKRLRQGLLMELERIERELSRIRCRLEPFDMGQNSVAKPIKLITRRSKSEPSSPYRTESLNLKTSSHLSPQIKKPIPSTSTAVILQAYSLSTRRNSGKLPGVVDSQKRSRSEERCKQKESKKDKMGRSRSMEASVGDDLLHKSPSYSHNQNTSSRERLSSRSSPCDDVLKEDKRDDPPLYLLPYETVEELAVAIDHIVSSGLGIRLIVSAPPVRLKSKEDLRSSSDNLKVAALSHRADFYHQYFEAHYGGNRQRNRVVREDHPRARREQEKEIEEALAIRNLQEQISRDQEEADASVARRLAEELEKEEEEQRRMNQFRDERVAKRMQNLLISDASTPQSLQCEQAEFSSHKRTYSGDGSSQTVPQASSSRDATFTNKHSRNTHDHPGYFGASSSTCHSSSNPPYPQKYGHSLVNSYKSSDAVFSANSKPVEEEEFRHVQEEQDAELARLLQEVEQHKNSNRKGPSTSTIDNVEQLDRDRMLAIEVQDRELARILQEKEKARLRRAKERTKLKASLKKEELTGENSGEKQRLRRGISPDESEFQQEEERRNEFSTRPPRRHDFNSIEVVTQNNPSDGNIATAIDPTYRNAMSTKDREFPKSRPLLVSTPGTSYSDRLMDEESEAPPYMPIAGQRRSLSLEKKKKGRDSCKQQ